MFKKTIINNKAFTLMELLVVMAITVILMGLVMGPLIQSFKLTRSAETLVEAQDSARSAMTQIDRDLSEAMFVFDNTPYKDSSNNPQNTIALPVYISPSATNAYLDYAKLDMIQPKMTAHCINPDHPVAESRDFPRDVEENGKRHVLASPECPACKAAGLDPLQVEVRPKLPIEQDVVIVRYFLGLMHNDPTQTDFGWKPQLDSNHVVIYRLEINPNDPLLFDPALNLTASAKAAIYNAPDFFYNTDPSNDPEESNPAVMKPLWKYWAEHATTIGIYKKQDLVSYVLNSDKTVKSVDPTVTFRFKHIDYDTLIGAYSTDKSFDYPTTIPAVFRAAHGYWTPGCQVAVYRDDETIAYSVDVDRNPDIAAVINKTTNGNNSLFQFDITDYLKNGTVPTDTEMAFTIDLNRGAVNFSIVPQKPTGVTSSVSPFDPAVINKDFKDHYDGTNGFTADPGTARRSGKLSTFDSTSTNYLANAQIVPGSERIVGPDYYAQNVRVKYERVPYGLGDPGPNQYKIDYDNGSVEFNSSYDQIIPEVGLIDVDYFVHFNKPGDVVKASYSTKSIVETHLGMRIIDSGTIKMIAVDLDSTTEVGNAIR